MHEASLAANVVEILEERVRDGLIKGRIRVVHLKIGRLSAVLPDHLQFMFEQVREGTALAEATLEIEIMPLRIACADCGETHDVQQPSFSCPNCRSPRIEILGGRELLVDAVEVL
jgi:hydrogenase nickel incorporation protein HypA/HybF